MVLDYKDGIATIEQRNRFYKGETVEFLPPVGEYFTHEVAYMENAEGEEIEVAPHPQMIIKMPVGREVSRDTIMRKKVGDRK